GRAREAGPGSTAGESSGNCSVRNGNSSVARSETLLKSNVNPWMMSVVGAFGSTIGSRSFVSSAGGRVGSPGTPGKGRSRSFDTFVTPEPDPLADSRQYSRGAVAVMKPSAATCRTKESPNADGRRSTPD